MKTYSNSGYYSLSAGAGEAGRQFDEVEPTIAHLFRFPHPALENLSYGAAFCRALLARDILRPTHELIVEVGGGLGDLADGFLQQLPARLPYLILDLSPQLQTAQRARLKDRAVYLRANGEKLPFLSGSLRGLIVSNEVIADFDAVEFTRAEWLESRDPLVEMLRVELPIDDEKVLLNTGAINFVQEVARVLSPGSSAVITEHGFHGNGRIAYCGVDDESSAHLEFSINFSHLELVAAAAGLQTESMQLIDLLNFDRTMRVANLNDAQSLHKVDPSWPVAAIPAREIAEQYQIELSQLCQAAGLSLPEIGGQGFPDDHTLPFAVSFKALILKKQF